MKINKGFLFNLIFSLIIVLFTDLTLMYIMYTKIKVIDFKVLGTFSFILFIVVNFFVSKLFRSYIENRIKAIYENNAEIVRKNNLNVLNLDDFDLLNRNISKYTDLKKKEINKLNSREDYRKDFLGNVAHELKTPLFTIQGYLLTLLEGAADDKEIREKYLRRAASGIDRLNDIVTDLDMITKLETNDLKLNIETFNIIKLIQKVFDLLEMQAKKRNIKLTFDRFYDFPEFVSADKAKIEQVLINLIMNSIKYGKQDGVTVISITYIDEEKLSIGIKDNGEGISKENLPRVFERFYRVDKSRTRGKQDQGGSGLGLSIVKHIIEAHDNTIGVESKLGKGSKFYFSLDKA